MARLLGIVHMNPEKDPSTWDHTDVSVILADYKYELIVVLASNRSLRPNLSQEDMYGIGAVRTPENFYEVFGIDVVNKKTEKHLCQFVDTGIMHNKFTKLIRRDGMGVDYGKISYKFKDPAPDEQ